MWDFHHSGEDNFGFCASLEPLAGCLRNIRTSPTTPTADSWTSLLRTSRNNTSNYQGSDADSQRDCYLSDVTFTYRLLRCRAHDITALLSGRFGEDWPCPSSSGGSPTCSQTPRQGASNFASQPFLATCCVNQCVVSNR